MMAKEKIEISDKPIYCKDCRSSESWERCPERDIKSESGKTMFKRWRCKICQKTTIYPVRENL